LFNLSKPDIRVSADVIRAAPVLHARLRTVPPREVVLVKGKALLLLQTALSRRGGIICHKAGALPNEEAPRSTTEKEESVDESWPKDAMGPVKRRRAAAVSDLWFINQEPTAG